MVTSVLTCPQCGAPIDPPGRFARRATCRFCAAVVEIDPSVVSASRYKDALARWNGAPPDAVGELVAFADGPWRLLRRLGSGTRTDVWLGERTRWPTERGILKIPRTADDTTAVSEAAALRAIAATGAAIVGSLLPELVAKAVVSDGGHSGRVVIITRAAPTFTSSLAELTRGRATGIDPLPSIWVWRRMLEVLRVLLAAGVVHDAPTADHWIVERREHGLRLVGFGHARVDPAAAPLAATAAVRGTAHTLASALGGTPGALPNTVPPALSSLIAELAELHARPLDPTALLALRDRVGAVGRACFGPPRFAPLL